jgi:glycosyltransferase involved in cell wall biosynthesis
MRLLCITNAYPPLAQGGYGEICADVMSGLADRGHRVKVLTCGAMLRGFVPASEPASNRRVEVERALHFVPAAWRKPLPGVRAVRHDQEVIQRTLAECWDAVLVWHLAGVMKTSLRLVHDSGVPVLYMLHDRWVLYERPGALYVRWAALDRLGAAALREAAGTLLSPLGLELRAPPIRSEGHVCFVSNWLEREHTRRGWFAEKAQIVRCGVDVPGFRSARGAPPERPPRTLLYAGRIEPRKGLDVLLRALAESGYDFELTVAGPLDDPGYLEQMQELAGKLGVADRIRWAGELSREEVRRALGSHDVLVFPSIEVEAYALGLLEALAAGILVVTSAEGGPLEYLAHGYNSLLFPPGDHSALAGCLEQLRNEPELAGQLETGAAETAERISLAAVLDQIERYLEDVSAGGEGRPPLREPAPDTVRPVQ